VDPWSLPPPEDGYENLAFEDVQAGAAARPAPPRMAAAAAPEPPGKDAAPEPPKPSGEDDAPELPKPSGEDDAAPIEGSSRRRVMLLAAAAAGAVVAAGVAVWIVRGGSSSTDSGAGEAVRVTVTQEPSWMGAPPLAPPDPSFTEPSRPAALPARPLGLASPPLRPSAPAAAPVRPAPSREPVRAPSSVPPPDPAEAAEAASADATAEVPEPTPPPEPEPAPGPAAAASAAIPIPPPPALPGPQAAPADGVQPGGKARAPALLTRTCVEDALRVPRGLEGRLPAEVVLRVKVDEDGRPTDVSFGSAFDPRLASALGAAVRSCRFVPGSDAGGRPAARTATMRVRFEP
jgi:TonB family protein